MHANGKNTVKSQGNGQMCLPPVILIGLIREIGNETGTTSMEACIKLVNVAKASLKGLQEDYEDYLHNHGNQIWDVNSQQCQTPPVFASCEVVHTQNTRTGKKPRNAMVSVCFLPVAFRNVY